MSSSHRRVTAGLAAVPVDVRRPNAGHRHFERLLVVADRLPATTEGAAEDGIEACAAALAPHLAGGAWIGGRKRSEATATPASTTPEVRPVDLPTEEARDHDLGFCRQTLRPLFRGDLEAARFEPLWWQAYRRVNRRFADAVAPLADPSTIVWVHGPQLSAVGALLRTRPPGRPAAALPGLAHFLHGPFPPRELFLGLPWRRELLAAFLSYDLLGFESRRAVEHFVDCLALIGGRGEFDGHRGSALVPCPESADGWRRVRLEVSPRGVDFRGISRLAETPRVREAVRELRAGAGGRRLLVVTEPLDPSGGLAPLLTAFAALLAARPDLVRRTALLLAVDPGSGSLTDGPLRGEIERRVGEINGRFSPAGSPSILYHHRRFDPTDPVAFHRAADVILSTPGQEPSGRGALAAAAARTDGDGVLVVSDLCAAVDRLAADPERGALKVNPYDVEAMTATILRALEMPEAERRRRMRSLRAIAADAAVESWVESFCRSAGLLPRRGSSLIDDRRPARRSPRRSPNGRAAQPA